MAGYKNGFRFEFTASDATGSIRVKFWGTGDGDAVRRAYGGVPENGVVSITGGTVGEWRGTKEIHVDQKGSGSVKAAEDASPEDYLPASKRDIPGMVKELRGAIAGVKNGQVRGLLESIFDDGFMKRYSRWPAARRMHHGYVGGLIEHVLTMVSAARLFASRYDALDEDLLVAGCILHDVGKLDEYTIGAAIGSSADGRLAGHIHMGAAMVSRKMDEIDGFDPVLRRKITHMVLSHHGADPNGDPAYGSAVPPMFPEAVALHKIDDCDAKIKTAVEVREDCGGGDGEFANDWRFGHMYVG